MGVVLILAANLGLTAAAVSNSTPVGPQPPNASQPPIGSVPPIANEPSSPPEATTRPPFTGPVWQPLLDFPFGDAFEVTSVTASGAGFAAVGFRPLSAGTPGLSQGVVWRSDDGRVWHSTADPVFNFATPEQIVALGESLFVFGTVSQCDPDSEDDCVEPPESGWAVWRSTAGGGWERLLQPPQMQAAIVYGVVAANPLLVAFGWTGDGDEAAIWTSADGVTWAQTTQVADMDPVTAMGGTPGGLVAFGNRFSEQVDDLELLAAVSTDGSQFLLVSAPAPPATTMNSVVAGAAGLVAVGDAADSDLNIDGIALYSADGLSWTQGAAADGSFAGSSIGFVHAVPQGYFAVGSLPQLDDFGTATGASWTSTDGRSWQAFGPFGDTFGDLTASAAAASGIVCFTLTEEGGSDEPLSTSVSAWFAPIEALPTQ